MERIIYITGGARSGKSAFAEQNTLKFGKPLLYLATAQAFDHEMNGRIIKHRQRRGEEWRTVEEPLQLTETLIHLDGKYNAVLVDCVTLWLTNLLLQDGTLADDYVSTMILEKVQELAATLPRLATPVILVTNELGMGIVPENRLARLFRDIAGSANQILAAAADEAWLVASGIPLKLK